MGLTTDCFVAMYLTAGSDSSAGETKALLPGAGRSLGISRSSVSQPNLMGHVRSAATGAALTASTRLVPWCQACYLPYFELPCCN